MRRLLIGLLLLSSSASAQIDLRPLSHPSEGLTPSPEGRYKFKFPENFASDKPSQAAAQDPAERAAFVSVCSIEDPLRRAAALENFVRSFPKRSMRIEALEREKSAYLKSGDPARPARVAETILTLQRDNVPALATLTEMKHAAGLQGDCRAAAEAGLYAERGIKALAGWKKSGGHLDADFAKSRDFLTIVFYTAAGYSAFTARNFPAGRDYYQNALRVDASNAEILYQLGIVESEMEPPDVKGFWHLARAIQLCAGAREGRGRSAHGPPCQGQVSALPRRRGRMGGAGVAGSHQHSPSGFHGHARGVLGCVAQQRGSTRLHGLYRPAARVHGPQRRFRFAQEQVRTARQSREMVFVFSTVHPLSCASA